MLPGDDLSPEVGDRADLLERSPGEGEVGHVAMPRHDGARAEGDQALERGRPVERIAVPEIRRRAVLQQVAGEEDPDGGHREDDVRVRVAAAQVAQLDLPSAHVDRGPLGERDGGRGEDDLAPLVLALGHLPDHLGAHRLAVLQQSCRAPVVAPHLRPDEDRVAEAMIVVVVRVDDPPDGPRQLPEVSHQLVTLALRGAGVDHQQARVTTDDTDGLVKEVIPPHPHPVGDLLPHRHGLHRTRA